MVQIIIIVFSDIYITAKYLHQVSCVFFTSCFHHFFLDYELPTRMIPPESVFKFNMLCCKYFFRSVLIRDTNITKWDIQPSTNIQKNCVTSSFRNQTASTFARHFNFLFLSSTLSECWRCCACTFVVRYTASIRMVCKTRG